MLTNRGAAEPRRLRGENKETPPAFFIAVFPPTALQSKRFSISHQVIVGHY